eukprot:TRINITY_DN39870_c0_g1_i1.p1 TRINITY_DN39870_c0_g1~~TRINITY_DN39870_c0_g1_i1.p1  ORF type:complete len:374 (-),score=93.75 TRINITY_DN39870_c0_g1_i1:88-1209(-)
MAPKAKGKEVEAPPGLPPGWKCIEKIYLSGKYAGSTYTRFESADGKHRSVGTMKQVLKLHAEENGLDADAEVAKYEKDQAQRQKEKKEQAAAEREKAGLVKGQKRDEAIELFEATHGKLDGSTVMALPGWRGESRHLEKCDQISAVYYDPENRPWRLLKDIAAMFGMKMLNGETDLPDFEKAKSERDVDNLARKNVVEKFEHVVNESQRPKKKARFKVIDDNDYKPRTKLSVSKIDVDSCKKNKQKDINDELDILNLLEQRAFSAIELLKVGAPAKETDDLMRNFTGTYFKMPDKFNEKPCFQRVRISHKGGLACPGQYLFWSLRRSGWKIGELDDAKAGLALCCEDVESPTLTTKPWLIWEPPYYINESVSS